VRKEKEGRKEGRREGRKGGFVSRLYLACFCPLLPSLPPSFRLSLSQCLALVIPTSFQHSDVKIQSPTEQERNKRRG